MQDFYIINSRNQEERHLREPGRAQGYGTWGSELLPKPYLELPKPTFFCRVPKNSMLGFIIRTCKKSRLW